MKLRALFLALVLGGLASVSFAADQMPNIDPRADEMLKRMGDYLGKAKHFCVKAEVWQDIDISSGDRIQAGRTLDMEVRRPNRLKVEVRSPHRDRELIYDGNGITLYNRKDNLYGTVHTSGPLDEAMDAASERFGIPMPLEDFLRTDPHRDLIEKAQSGRDIGPVNVMGVPCEHLLFSRDNMDWQVWVEKGPKPVPKKFVITYKDEPDSPQFTAIFDHWDFNTELPDFVFKFEPAQGAAQIPVREMRAQVQPRGHAQPRKE
jgi:hypothetical protein